MQSTSPTASDSPSTSIRSRLTALITPRADRARTQRRWTRLAALIAAPAALAGALSLSSAVAASASTQATGRAATLPSYCATGGASLWSNLATCGWPGPTNTGPDLTQCPNGQLTAVGTSPSQAIVFKTANAVISCENITGMVTIAAPNVTIQNSVVTSNSGKLGIAANGTAGITVNDGASATISKVTVNGSNGVHACVWDQGTSMSVNAINCYGVDDGIFSWADNTYSQTTGNNFNITNSYFHDFTTATSNGHEDGYQTEGASNGLIQHNTYQLTTAADSAIAIWDSRRSADSITVSNNLITGGGFAMYAEDYNPGTGAPGDYSASSGYSVTGIQFTNNSFSTYAAGCVGRYGVWFARPTWTPYQGGPTDGWHRSGNVVLETGEHIDSANPHQGNTLCS
jgi:hypothetical protein